MNATNLTLVAAYGRHYESIKKIEADWEAGKDFRIIRGPYCSIRDTNWMKEMGIKTVVIVNSIPLLAVLIAL